MNRNCTDNIHYDFKGKDIKDIVVPLKKLKAVTINNKTITYTHCIPSSIDLVKFTWKQRLKILFKSFSIAKIVAFITSFL